VAQKNGENLSLLASGIKVFEVNNAGIVSTYPGVVLALDEAAEGNYL